MLNELYFYSFVKNNYKPFGYKILLYERVEEYAFFAVIVSFFDVFSIPYCARYDFFGDWLSFSTTLCAYF